MSDLFIGMLIGISIKTIVEIIFAIWKEGK